MSLSLKNSLTGNIGVCTYNSKVLLSEIVAGSLFM